MNTEIWKDIIGYEGLYQISSMEELKDLQGDFIRRKKINGNQLKK